MRRLLFPAVRLYLHRRDSSTRVVVVRRHTALSSSDRRHIGYVLDEKATPQRQVCRDVPREIIRENLIRVKFTTFSVPGFMEIFYRNFQLLLSFLSVILYLSVLSCAFFVFSLINNYSVAVFAMYLLSICRVFT